MISPPKGELSNRNPSTWTAAINRTFKPGPDAQLISRSSLIGSKPEFPTR